MTRQSDRPVAARFKVTRRTALGSLAMPFISIRGRAWAADQIVVASWGGGWATAMTEAFYKPFTKETGISVVVASGTDLAKAKAQVMTKNVEWDVVELSTGWLATGLKEGLWEKIDTSVVDMTNTVPGTQNPYAIGMCMSSGGIAWNGKDHPDGTHPVDWQGFWDVEKYPGRRGMMSRITGVLEYALMADGVDPKKLYPLDVERGFKSLDRIKPHVNNWVAAMPQTVSLLQSGELDFCESAAGRVFIARSQNVPLGYAVGSALVGPIYVAILKGDRKKDLAMSLLAFEMRPDRQAAFARLTSYGPTKLAAVKLLSPELLALSPDLSAPGTAMSNEFWWADNFEALDRRFKEWQLT